MKNCILIFDDDVEILLVCKLILERQNYIVETRANCDNIIQVINEVKPGIVLMDLWIPPIGGQSALHLMKNDGATQHIPAILFSANADIQEISEQINANGFLRKPFEITELSQIIEANILK